MTTATALGSRQPQVFTWPAACFLPASKRPSRKDKDERGKQHVLLRHTESTSQAVYAGELKSNGNDSTNVIQ